MLRGMIDKIANQQPSRFDPRNHATFGVVSKTGRSAAGFEREHFDGHEKLPGLIVSADREGMKGAVGERVAVGRHLGRRYVPAAEVCKQFVARHTAAFLNLVPPAGEFRHPPGIVRDLKHLEVPGEPLALFRRPAFHFVTDFCVAHVFRVPQPIGTANPFFVFPRNSMLAFPFCFWTSFAGAGQQPERIELHRVNVCSETSNSAAP